MEKSTTSGSNASAANTATSNGVPEHQTNGSESCDAQSQAMKRAEELVDRWGEQVGQYATSFGHGVLKWVARAREEAEDIWAEAQSIREKRREGNDHSSESPPAKG